MNRDVLKDMACVEDEEFRITLETLTRAQWINPESVDKWFMMHMCDNRVTRTVVNMLSSFIMEVIFDKEVLMEDAFKELQDVIDNFDASMCSNVGNVHPEEIQAFLSNFITEVFWYTYGDKFHLNDNMFALPSSGFRSTLVGIFHLTYSFKDLDRFIENYPNDCSVDDTRQYCESLAVYICKLVFNINLDGESAIKFIDAFTSGRSNKDKLILDFIENEKWDVKKQFSKGDRIIQLLNSFTYDLGNERMNKLHRIIHDLKARKIKENKLMNNKNREIKTHMYRGAMSDENLKNNISPDCDKCQCNKNDGLDKAMNVDQLITILMHADKSAPIPPEVEAWAKLIEHEEEEFTPFIRVRERIQAFTTKEIGPVMIKDVDTKDKQIDRLAQEICNIVFEIHPPTAKECLRYVTYVYRNVRNLLSNNIDQLTPWEYCPEFWTSCIVDRGWGQIGNDEKVHLNNLGNDIYDLLEAFDLFIHASKVITNK